MVPKPDIERFFHSLKRKFYFSFECLPAPTCPSTNQSASGEDVALDPRGSTQTGQSLGNVNRLKYMSVKIHPGLDFILFISVNMFITSVSLQVDGRGYTEGEEQTSNFLESYVM